MHQIVELGHIAVGGVHRDDLVLAGGGIVVTRVIASTAAKQRRRAAHRQDQAEHSFFCMIFSLDPMVSPPFLELGGAVRGMIACEVSRRYEFRRRYVKKPTKFTLLYAKKPCIAR